MYFQTTMELNWKSTKEKSENKTSIWKLIQLQLLIDQGEKIASDIKKRMKENTTYQNV